VIEARRRDPRLEERRDILSLLRGARTEGGERLTDQEVRDELVGLVLAGHETTANSLAWAWERLLRAPEAHEQLLEAVRSGAGSAEQVEAAIVETMRSRPVIPFVGRRVIVPWRLGAHAVPAGTAIGLSVLLVHHREELYPEPFEFKPQRWLGKKPGTYEWIPFGGGVRRCLGSALAMAELRVVLEAMARRVDLVAEDPAPERALHRNVTMIPAKGVRVIVRGRLG
jgi:cytochrome P450